MLIGHPADTIKVRQQLFQSSGMIHIAIQTIKYEGVSREENNIFNNNASGLFPCHMLSQSIKQPNLLIVLESCAMLCWQNEAVYCTMQI